MTVINNMNWYWNLIIAVWPTNWYNCLYSTVQYCTSPYVLYCRDYLFGKMMKITGMQEIYSVAVAVELDAKRSSPNNPSRPLEREKYRRRNDRCVNVLVSKQSKQNYHRGLGKPLTYRTAQHSLRTVRTYSVRLKSPKLNDGRRTQRPGRARFPARLAYRHSVQS